MQSDHDNSFPCLFMNNLTVRNVQTGRNAQTGGIIFVIFAHCAPYSFQSADCFSSKSAQLTTRSQRQIVRKKKEEEKGIRESSVYSNCIPILSRNQKFSHLVYFSFIG